MPGVESEARLARVYWNGNRYSRKLATSLMIAPSYSYVDTEFSAFPQDENKQISMVTM